MMEEEKETWLMWEEWDLKRFERETAVFNMRRSRHKKRRRHPSADDSSAAVSMSSMSSVPTKFSPHVPKKKKRSLSAS